MFQGKKVGALLLMGGEGRRFCSDIPKQFHLLAGKEVYRHTLDAVLSAGFFDEIVLVTHTDWVDGLEAGVKVAIGGNTRQESSFRGLKAFEKMPDIVLIHDAVRPFVTERILRENIAGAIEWGAVDTCIPTADTLVHAPDGQRISSIPKREEYLRGQTPQTFRMDWIVEAHEKAMADGIENASDDCRLVLRLGKPIHVVAGEERNLKITSSLDLFLAEQMITTLPLSDLTLRK